MRAKFQWSLGVLGGKTLFPSSSNPAPRPPIVCSRSRGAATSPASGGRHQNFCLPPLAGEASVINVKRLLKRAAANSLIRLGDIGRPSQIEGMRELSVRVAPYVIAYRAEAEVIDIIAIYHNAQNR